jgi:hypothetical protein
VAVGLHHPCLFFSFPSPLLVFCFRVVGSVVQNPGTRNLARERCGVGGANANQVDAKISAQVFTSTPPQQKGGSRVIPLFIPPTTLRRTLGTSRFSSTVLTRGRNTDKPTHTC